MLIKGFVSTFNHKDRCDDIVSPVAYDRFVKDFNHKERLLPLQLAHEPPYLGYASKLEIVEFRGLYAEFTVFPHARTVISELFESNRAIGLSIGYDTSSHEYCEDTRILREIRIIEVSLVAAPANEECWATISLKDPSAERNGPLRQLWRIITNPFRERDS